MQKAKFEYIPLGQVFNKGLDFNEKQEVGLLKRLKNIEDKTDNQLVAAKNNQSGLKSIGYAIKERLPEKAIKAFDDIVDKDKIINYRKLDYRGGNNVDYFTSFSSVGELFKQIYHGKI